MSNYRISDGGPSGRRRDEGFRDGYRDAHRTPPRPSAVGPGGATASDAGADEPVFDLPRLLEILQFPLRSVMRHPKLAALCLCGFLLLGITAAVALPKTYISESKILTRRNMILPALGNPRRTVPTESDAPARLANEVIMSRENLLELIKETGLRTGWPATLPPATRLIEAVRERIEGPRDEKERLDVLVKQLQKRLYVMGGDESEGTVTIAVGWTDPELSLRIVKVAQDRFLAERYSQDVSLVQESVSILERYVERAGANMSAAMDSLRTLPGVKVSVPEATSFATSARTAARTRAMTAEMTRLQTALQDVRAGLAQQEATFNNRQAETAARLADLATRYGSNHPEVIAAREVAQQASVPPASLTAARQEEKQLSTQLSALGVTAASQPDVSAELALQREGFERLLRQRGDTIEDPRITNARSQLKIATTTYEDMLDRLEAAKIELETARAAFKYRYAVTAPPQLPKEPKAPNGALLLLGGALCGILTALLAVTARDLLDGRVLELWQIRRQIGLPVLGEIELG